MATNYWFPAFTSQVVDWDKEMCFMPVMPINIINFHDVEQLELACFA
jgi:hypothetical protein